MQNSKQHFFTLAFIGCLWLALILGCTPPKENSNSGQSSSPATSPTNTATTSSSPARSTAKTSPTTASTPASTAGVTMENYNRLKTGMTYVQVVQILGKEGEELSSNEIGGYKTVMYKWDGDAGWGANMNAMFQNGKLNSKSQFGLK